MVWHLSPASRSQTQTLGLSTLVGPSHGHRGSSLPQLVTAEILQVVAVWMQSISSHVVAMS